MSDAEAVLQALEQFGLLAQEEKRRRILLWVQRPSRLAQQALKKIAAEDPEAQIRYLARKGLSHIQKKSAHVAGLTRDTPLEAITGAILGEDIAKATAMLEACASTRRQDVADWLEENLESIQEAWVLASALISLSRLKSDSAFERIRPFFTHKDARVRASAVEAFGVLGTEEAQPYLFSALKSRDHRVRSNAIRALKSQERARVLDSLKQMSTSGEDWMRHAAAFALGEFRSGEVLETLAELLADKVEAIRKMAIQSMHKLADAGVQEVVQLAAYVGDSPEAENLRDFMQVLKNQDPVRPEDLLQSEDSQKRLLEIHRIVGEKDTERYRELEARLVVEEDNFIKASLILALGRIRQASAIPLIQSFLKDPIPRLRANAIEALASFQRKELLPEVLLLLDDHNNRARANAILALAKMPYVDVMTPLKDMCSSEDEKVRHSAFYVLTEMGIDACRKLLPVLILRARPALRKSIQEHLEFLSDEGEDVIELARQMGLEKAPEVDARTDEQEASVEESSLDVDAPSYRESDFEGFQPDNLNPTDIEQVTLKEFLSAKPEKRSQMVDFMKTRPSQEHYTILRIAEKDTDFQVKVLARIAVTQMKGEGFSEENLDNALKAVGHDAQPSHMFLPQLGVIKEKLEFMGSEPTPALNQDLKRRQEAKDWGGGILPGAPLVMRSMRLDTQEMLSALLGSSVEKLRLVTLLYYSPTYRAFFEGQKSLDNVAMENYVQMSTLKTSLIQSGEEDPISTWIKTSAAPKYLLLLLNSENLYLFLRQALQYRNAESVRIPLKSIHSAKVEKNEHWTQVVLSMEKGANLILPRMLHKHAEELVKLLE